MDEQHETPENNPSHATGKKATNAEIDGRVEEIYIRLLQRQPRKEVVAYYTQEWGVSVKTIDNYIARARKLIARDARLKKEDELDLARANLDFLYRQLCKIQDYKGALSVVKSRAELLGLNAATKHELNILVDFAPTLLRLIDVLTNAGLSPADVFERMIQRVQAERVTADADHDRD